MPSVLAGLLAALQLMLPLTPQMMTQRLRSGEWLRFHVVAQDDTDEMQRVKLCVRDAVQQCYRENHAPNAFSMQEQAQALLPCLTEAAVAAARQEGFTGPVAVTLGTCTFDDRNLWGTDIPAGEYPALMIRLGDAKGQNWWGLLDPELSLLLARVPQTEEGERIVWDWSWEAFWAALLGIPTTAEGT